MDYEEISELDFINTLPYYRIEILNNILNHQNKIKTFKRFLLVASVVIAITIGCWSIFHINQPKSFKTNLERKGMVHVVNLNLKDKNYVLPDSSFIQLKPNTEISYDSLNFKKNRILYQLKGTSLFQVKSNMNYPFTVIANHILTTATGTEFSVENNQSKNQVIVYLIKGVVTLNSSHEHFKLNNFQLYPSQVCTLDLSNSAIHIKENAIVKSYKTTNEISKEELKNELVWTNKEIIFNKIKLRDLFIHLENHYSVKFNIVDAALNQSTITGKIYYEDSLDTIVRAICEISGLSYSIQQNQYFIKVKNKPLKLDN
ncbi:FecR family protein [Sphingobacterium sp. HJSM2_6]|uniref:FecR family protein n=1 Tax=Sphingobacterium sp. HJSM2_6 TaxID=3366264 RepID=UPI003BEE9992